MAETPAVALLFEDVALGDQLRSALQERGAQIVHEGGLSALNREQLRGLNADVLVINLEDDDDDALDTLYAVIEGDRPRVVFNDAQASRALDGWDRARWARHLAVKVMAEGDIDPPRPTDALPYEPAAVSAAEPAPAEPVAPEILPDDQDTLTRQTVAESETLAAELEALIAAGDDAEPADEFGSGLNYAAGDDALLDDSDFAAGLAAPAVEAFAATTEAEAEPLEPMVADEAESEPVSPMVADEAEAEPVGPLTLAEPGADGEPITDAQASTGDTPEGGPDATGMPSADDGDDAEPAQQPASLELAPVDEAWVAEVSTQADAIPKATFTAPRSPDGWSLVEQSDEPAASAHEEPQDASAFGIEKLSAADYLAPEADEGESPIVLGMSLELVSMEEAVAPKAFEAAEHSNEMMLGEPTGALGRLLVLGATTESTHSVCEFLSSLPAGLRMAVLHTQHLSGKPADALVEHLAEHCALPVRLATPGSRAVAGEVLVVPSDQQVRVLRDGSLVFEACKSKQMQMPSIDVSFTHAADVFGRHALAIVFAGHSTDAFGGCQAVHDRGGQVWVEDGSGEHHGDMVGAILAEHLSHFAGTPQQLAARLIEQFSKEVRA